MSKKYSITSENLIQFFEHNGGCVVTDRITVDGCEIGYMYCEETDREGDTGWRFFEGSESQEYLDQVTNCSVWSVNTIANHDPSILEYLDTPPPCAFEKVAGTRRFVRVHQ